MRKCSLLILLIYMLGVCLPAGTAEPWTYVIPEETEAEIEAIEAADEAEDRAEVTEAGEEGLWLGRVKLARNDFIALRNIMTVGTNYNATGTAQKGEIVTVLREENGWLYVRSQNGEGYILPKFLTRVEPGEAEPGLPTPEPAPTEEPLPIEMEEYNPDSYLDTRAAFPAETGEARKVLLSFIGDVTLGCNEDDHRDARSITSYVKRYGYEYPFRKVRYILEQDDLTIANLEGTFHSNSSGLTLQTKKAYNFRAAPDFVEALKQASVEAVAVGNNHSGDYGAPGFEETAAVLDESGIAWFGNTDYSTKGWVYEIDGIRVGFVSCYISHWVMGNGENIPKISATIEDVKAQGVDVLIAYMHGGVEYDAKHDNNQERFARYFIGRGADIVIGSHPHRLQGCELIDGVPVFYSLGNFVFGGNFKFYNKKRNTYISNTAILQCALSFDGDHKYLGCRFNVIPCRLGEDTVWNRYQPFPVTGEEADICMKELQVDTENTWRLENVQPGIGAMQMFIPAKDK